MQNNHLNELHTVDIQLLSAIEKIGVISKRFSLVGLRFLYLITKHDEITIDQPINIYVSRYSDTFGYSTSDNSGIYQSLKRFVKNIQHESFFEDIQYVNKGKYSYITICISNESLENIDGIKELTKSTVINSSIRLKSVYSLRLFFVLDHLYKHNKTKNNILEICMNYLMLRQLFGFSSEDYLISNNFWTVFKVSINELVNSKILHELYEVSFEGISDNKIVFFKFKPDHKG